MISELHIQFFTNILTDLVYIHITIYKPSKQQEKLIPQNQKLFHKEKLENNLLWSRVDFHQNFKLKNPCGSSDILLTEETFMQAVVLMSLRFV